MIKVIGLSKNYNSIRAVDNVSFEIKKGEVFGLLGPNGAGKTTIIKQLTTLSKPDAGQCLINGLDVQEVPFEVKQLIGVVPQENNLDRELTAYENLLIYSLLHRVINREIRIKETLEMARLWERRDSIVMSLSGGMQRRLLIARALLTEPCILFLDEPSIGLDPQIRRGLWDVIRKTRIEGRTVVITTHYIEEAESLCDRVGILAKGQLIAIDSPQTLKSTVGEYVVEFIEPSDGRLIQHIAKDRDQAYEMAKNRGAVSTCSGSPCAEIPCDSSNSSSNGVIIRRSNLEDVFIKLTGERIEP